MTAAPCFWHKFRRAEPAVVMLPVEVTVTGPPAGRAKIPPARSPVVVMLPVEVTVTAAAAIARHKSRAASPAVVMLPVEVTVTVPAPRLRAKIPFRVAVGGDAERAGVAGDGDGAGGNETDAAVPLAGAMAWFRLLTLRVVTGGRASAGDPGGLIAGAGLDRAGTVDRAGTSGPASAGPANASDSAPAATVPRNASRKRRPAGPPAAAVPPGQAHTFVIEIPNSPEIQLEGIDIERNRARLSRPPAAESIPPKQAKGAAIRQHWRENRPERSPPAAIDSRMSNAPWIALPSRAT